MEEWKDIPGYEGLYQVSNQGNIKSILQKRNNKTRDKLIKGGIKNGYKSVNLRKSGIYKTLFVHRLVAKVFIENPENKPHVNHINGIKTYNTYENLEWCTPSENRVHALKILGVKTNSVKVNSFYDGKYHLFESISSAAKNYGISQSSIYKGILTGKSIKGILFAKL